MNRTARFSLTALSLIVLLPGFLGLRARHGSARAQDTGQMATSPPLITVEQKPFISTVTEIAGPDDGESGRNIQVPNSGKVDPPEAFWDVPFAVHIPFEIPYSAEFVTVCFDPNLFWEDPPRGTETLDQLEKDKWREWRIQSHGVYRMDSKRLADNSVQWEVLDSGSMDPKPIWFYEGGSLPVWINAKQPPEPNARTDTFMGDTTPFGERRPFDPPAPRALSLSPAEAGWYVFWAAIHPDSLASGNWPEHLRDRDSLKARIRVHYVVMRGTVPREVEKYFFNGAVLPHLFGYGGQPAMGANASDRLYRAATVEIPVTVRRDGWVFDRIELRPRQTSAFPIAGNLDDARQQSPSEVTTETSVEGRGARLRYLRKVYERIDGRLTPSGEEYRLEWRPSFPAEIRDNHIADAQLEGSGVHKPKDGPAQDWFSGGLSSQLGVYGIIGPGMQRGEFERSMRDYQAKRVSEDEIKSWWFDPPQKDGSGRLLSPEKSGAWRTRFWSSYARTLFEGERRKLLFTDAGSHPVLTATCGPWEVLAFYRRLKDVEAIKPAGGVAAPTTSEADVGDDYWEWLQEFREGANEKEARVQEIRYSLRALYQQWQAARVRWFRLLVMEMQIPLPEDNPAQAQSGRRTREVMKEQRANIEGELADLRSRQRALIEEASRIRQELFESAGVRSVGFRGRHPEIQKLVDHLQDRRDITRLELLDAAGLYDSQELPKAIEELQFTSSAVNEVARLMQAKVARARAETLDQRARVARASPTFDPNAPFALADEIREAYIESWRILRELVRDSAEAGEAKTSLKELELKFLGWIVAKLEGERQANLDGLHRYLVERGFSADDPRGWWDGTWEFVKIWFSSSPVSLGARIQEDPEAVAQLVGDTQMEIAANQVSLLAIQRLRRNGVPLHRIAEITPEVLAQNMAPRTPAGSEFPPEKARRLCQDIRETFAALGDLRALADGDAEGFSQQFAKMYYGVIDANRNWIEHVSDLFLSPVGLTMFLGPGAVVKAGGKWALHSSAIAAGEKTVAVTDLFLPAARVQRIAKALPKPVQDFMTRAVLEDAAFLQEIGGLERFLRADVGRLVATIAIYGGLSEAATANDLPMLKYLFDVVGMLNVGDRLHGVLARAGVNPNRLVIKAEQYLAALGRAEAQLAEAEQAILSLEKIRKRLASAPPGPGRRLAEDELREISGIQDKLLSRRLGVQRGAGELMPLPDTPGVTVAADLDLAVMSATKSLQTGAVKEAESALIGAKTAGSQAKKIVEQEKQVVTQAKEALGAPGPTVAAPVAATVAAPVKSLTVREEMAANKARFFLPESGYPATDYGRAMQLGDEALIKGDLEEAFRAYQNAKTLASAHPATEVHNFINERIGLTARAKTAAARQAKLRAPQPMTEKATQITKDEEDRLVALAAGDDVYLEQIEGGINAAYVVKDKEGKILYFFKKPIPNPQLSAELAASDIPVELAAPALARELSVSLGQGPGGGINVAASRKVGFGKIRIKDDKGVESVVDNMEGLLFHYVPGRTIWDLGEGELIALKSEIARQQVFRIWLGDADGHFGNIRLGDDGHLWPIDFGMGHLMRDRVVKSRLGETFSGQRELLEGAASFPKAVFGYYKNVENAAAAVQKYGMMARLEEMMSYGDMEKTVEAIRNLAADRPRLRSLLEESLQNKELVDDAVEVLIERANVLEDVLKARMSKLRPGIPTAAVVPLDRTRRLAPAGVRFFLASGGTRGSRSLPMAA